MDALLRPLSPTHHRLSTVLLRLLIATLAFVAAARAQTNWYSCSLDGAHQVPPVVTAATGWAIAKHDVAAGTLQIYIRHDALSASATNALVHIGSVGQPPTPGQLATGLVPLSQSTQDIWTGTGTLNAAQAAALAQDGIHIKVASAAHPSGEIRGQITKAKNTLLMAVLSGSQVSPPTNSFASGTAVAFLHEPENRLCYVIQTAGIAGATAAHVHIGMPGNNGPMVVTAGTNGGQWCGVSDRLTDAEAQAVQAEQVYVDIHTAAYPNGEIRGQLRVDLGSCFTAACNGAQEAPPNASTAIASASLVVGPDDNVTLSGTFTGTHLVAAHVHLGAPGVAGPIVFPIAWSNTTGELSATYQATPIDAANLRAGLWYVNLHSSAFPGGEVRGQLLPGAPATPYGKGCRTGAGLLPEANLDGLACIGTTANFQLYGALGCPFAISCIGQDRSNGLPLHLPLIGIQAPDCHALTDILLTQFVLPDSKGLAVAPLSIPLDPAFRGVQLNNQWLLFDAFANAAGIAVSNGLAFSLN